jgi:hypothetical protein
MKRNLALAAAVLAAFALTVQTADAGSRRLDKRITVVGIGVGVASTAAFFAINDWKWSDWNNSSGLTRAGAWAVTTVACAAVAPMVATVVVNRPLTQREGHVLVGGCVVPIVGGWLVNAAYKANPAWEPGPAPRAWKKRAKKM